MSGKPSGKMGHIQPVTSIDTTSGILHAARYTNSFGKVSVCYDFKSLPGSSSVTD
jgi:hypothetical protein